MHGVQSQRLRAAVRHKLAQLASFNKSVCFSISGQWEVFSRLDPPPLKWKHSGSVQQYFVEHYKILQILQIKRRTAVMLSRDMEG
jgi:hypothetical protein